MCTDIMADSWQRVGSGTLILGKVHRGYTDLSQKCLSIYKQLLFFIGTIYS